MEMRNLEITLNHIVKARETLKDIAYKTSIVHNTTFSEMSGNFVYLKMENLQKLVHLSFAAPITR